MIALTQEKRVWLADDDPALPPEKLKARLKERAKVARRKDRAFAQALGLPAEDLPKGGRPTKQEVKPNTLQTRKRKAEGKAALALVDVGLCDFHRHPHMELALAAADETAAVAAAAADQGAAEQAAAQQAVAEAAAEAQAEAAIKAAATED